jgi:F-type H+-transporting ATPase subunit delta
MKIKKREKRDAKQLFRCCLVDGVLDESRVRSVVQHVAAARRSEGLAVLSHFKRLVKLELIRRTATIESAAPLPADLQAAVEAGLKRRYGVALRTAFALRPALIGGMRIQVASDVYDGSVRTELAALENSF